MVDEAHLEESGAGLEPAEPGWFVVNVGDAAWRTHRGKFGSSCRFERPQAWFEQLGVNIRVLQPGQPNCYYHSESLEEAFLVLRGECLLLVNGEERPLKEWDFVFCPPGVEHVFVGAGDGPSIILMVGARSEDERLLYPVSELAQKYGAGVDKETTSPDEAYAGLPSPEYERPEGWMDLPWTRSTVSGS